MKYKVGDKVRINTQQNHAVVDTCDYPHCATVNTEMRQLDYSTTNKEYTIDTVESGSEAYILFGVNRWGFSDCMLEDVPVVTVEKPKTPRKKLPKLPKGQFYYGEIALDEINSTDELVPTSANKITLQKEDKNALALAVRENYPAILIGEAGTGKTTAIKELAFLRKQPYVRVNMTGFTTPDELIGTKSVKDGATYFENGIISNAMERGAILVIDEINATSPDCLFILHGLLDEDKRVTLPNGEIITPHKDFRVFATCNPDYEGTKTMNKAFMDRFPIVVEVDVLPPLQEKNLLATRTGIDLDIADSLVTIATLARHDYIEQKIMTYISTRSLLNIANLIKHGLSPRTAYETTIVKKTTNKEEKKILTDFFLSVMKLAQGEESMLDKPTVTTQRELNELTESKDKAQRELQEYVTKSNNLLMQVGDLERNYKQLVQEREETARVSLERMEENKKLREQLEAYKRLEEIISKASQAVQKEEK